MGEKNMDISMENIPGGITAVEGIEAAGVTCGLKKNGDKDFALIYCREPAVAAASPAPRREVEARMGMETR